MNPITRIRTSNYYLRTNAGARGFGGTESEPMKTIRIISCRMMNAATPVILGPGRAGHTITGYYPRTSDGKRKPKLRGERLTPRL
jgi:hypothetical protein